MTSRRQNIGFLPPDADAVDALTNVVGAKGIIASADAAAYLSEWRNRWTGESALIIAPKSLRETQAIVEICAERKIAITPQGGNTGLVGGQIPFGPEILLTTKRMRQIREIEPLNNTMTVDAGVTLTEAQEAAASADRLFPLSIGSEGTCQIGGVISTNAGGVNVLRYGNTRDLVLGLEAVMPDGSIFNGLKRLRKDNTGYDLKHLLIGGEGTLGIVTGAVLKLFPVPSEKITVFAGLTDPTAAVKLLSHAQQATGGAATSYELIARECVDLVTAHIANTRDPLAAIHPWYVLMEFSAGMAGSLRDHVETALGSALEAGLITDATIGENASQCAMFWHLRHSISEAMNHAGTGIRLDVSVATSDIPAFLTKADATVRQIAGDSVRIVSFGHMGDGNVHYDIVPAKGDEKTALDPLRATIQEAIYDIIQSFGGSISAEHGVGLHKRDAIAHRKSATELAMMRAIKSALDPQGIMNPGKMLSSISNDEKKEL